MPTELAAPDAGIRRLHDCAQTIIQACGAISYLAHTLDSTQTMLEIISRSKGPDPSFDTGLVHSVEIGNEVLALLYKAMNLLGDAPVHEEPSEDDVKATTAAFWRCRRLLKPREHPAGTQSYTDLAASGGIVEAP